MLLMVLWLLLVGSNRTFMELKYAHPDHGSEPRRRSNRTFMELKYGFGVAKSWTNSVLIAPLWN